MTCPTDLLPGDVFCTRNAGGPETDERGGGNETPGFWNHCAIYVGDRIVVEAQEQALPGPPWFISGSGVIETDLEVFWDRYPRILVLRCLKSSPMSALAADEARQLVGLEYRHIASIFRHLREGKGENCVSVVRKAYENASGDDPRWKIPDDVAQDRAFDVVAEKKIAA